MNLPVENAQKPPKGFSEKLVRLNLDTQSFVIPVNYLNPKGEDSPEMKNVDSFGFVLFLPDFVGYTPNNTDIYAWRSGRVRDLIAVTQVSEVVKFQMRDGKRAELRDSAWGKPQAVFDTLRLPNMVLARDDYGLQCFAIKTPTGDFYHSLCKGLRSNGEMAVLSADEQEKENPLFLVRGNYSSEQDGLHIRYAFSRHNLSRWQEIDDAIWVKIRAWRVK